MIELVDVCKEYKDCESPVQALRGISLKICEGEMIGIMGASGSGKSTLLNVIGGMDTVSSGTYYFNGKLISDFGERELHTFRKQNISFIFQNFALLEKYSVYENVEMPLRARKSKQKRDKVMYALKCMGLEEKKGKLPGQLSGGERQRCAIARAIVSDTPVILADEPTGSLDRKTGERIMDYLCELNQNGKTIVIVTHDAKVAQRCSRVLWIEDGSLFLNEEQREENGEMV